MLQLTSLLLILVKIGKEVDSFKENGLSEA